MQIRATSAAVLAAAAAAALAAPSPAASAAVASKPAYRYTNVDVKLGSTARFNDYLVTVPVRYRLLEHGRRDPNDSTAPALQVKVVQGRNNGWEYGEDLKADGRWHSTTVTVETSLRPRASFHAGKATARVFLQKWPGGPTLDRDSGTITLKG